VIVTAEATEAMTKLDRAVNERALNITRYGKKIRTQRTVMQKIASNKNALFQNQQLVC
jgi:hypothetical protein